VSDIFYLRPIDPPATPEDVRAMARHAGGCFDLHGVDWKHSFLAADGARMLCWYTAPDAESARLALRQLGSDMNAVWAGSPFEGPGGLPVTEANVAAEVELDEPLGEAKLDERVAELERPGVTLVRGFLSNRRNRLVAVFRAADERAVGDALRAARLPAQSIWVCRSLTPREPVAE
jgi:hypothetical protein